MKIYNARTGTRRGMTLIEVMIGMLVSSIALAGVAISVIYATRLNYLSAQKFAAFQYCKDMLEQLRDRKFNEISQGFPSFSGTPAQSTLTENNLPLMSQGTSGQVTINGTRTTRLTNQTAASDSRYDVRITFSWQARLYRGAPRTYTITLDSRLYPR